MKQLRDVDFNVRYIATEGFSRMIMCESTDKVYDFLSRLMLLQFEKIVSRALTSKEMEIHIRIKMTIEQLLSHFVRLSRARCVQVSIAAIQVLYYLLKAKSSSQGLERPSLPCDPNFLQVNLFYLFGTITDLLKFDYNRDFSIFDFTESKHPISFQLQFFEFLCLSLLTATPNTSTTQ